MTVWSSQKTGYLYQEGGVVSPDGHTRTFDAKAQGSVGGNGVGVVLLKRLEDALAEGDHIYAIIRGAAVNNDGAMKVGYTAPSIDAQTEVILAAQALADVDVETISYIEAHGTATALGDPVEIAALTRAFRESTEKTGFLRVGAVKTSIGHLDAAAGIAGLIKTTLALTHKQIPPSLNFETPNPQIDFENSPFYVNTTLQDWAANGHPRRAGVNSLGIGGTNAHVVLEEAPPRPLRRPARPAYPLVLSAQTESALRQMARNLRQHLQENPDVNLADVAYTLLVGRKAFAQRQTVVADSIETAITTLGKVETAVACQQGRTVAFVFPGCRFGTGEQRTSSVQTRTCFPRNGG
ncbi:MAG: type I polyketide synthase [Chloroflexi bacterium]|nr:type I polyketide synthase [Chloroflexota bacterium]